MKSAAPRPGARATGWISLPNTHFRPQEKETTVPFSEESFARAGPAKGGLSKPKTFEILLMCFLFFSFWPLFKKNNLEVDLNFLLSEL